jgi:hypothetical protein
MRVDGQRAGDTAANALMTKFSASERQIDH